MICWNNYTIVNLCTKKLFTYIYEPTNLNSDERRRRKRFYTTIQTLYQYGMASFTVLLEVMLAKAARRARSRLHMGQEEILGVFNHVFCSKKEKKNREF